MVQDERVAEIEKLQQYNSLMIANKRNMAMVETLQERNRLLVIRLATIEGVLMQELGNIGELVRAHLQNAMAEALKQADALLPEEVNDAETT